MYFNNPNIASNRSCNLQHCLICTSPINIDAGGIAIKSERGNGNLLNSCSHQLRFTTIRKCFDLRYLRELVENPIIPLCQRCEVRVLHLANLYQQTSELEVSIREEAAISNPSFLTNISSCITQPYSGYRMFQPIAIHPPGVVGGRADVNYGVGVHNTIVAAPPPRPIVYDQTAMEELYTRTPLERLISYLRILQPQAGASLPDAPPQTGLPPQTGPPSPVGHSAPVATDMFDVRKSEVLSTGAEYGSEGASGDLNVDELSDIGVGDDDEMTNGGVIITSDNETPVSGKKFAFDASVIDVVSESGERPNFATNNASINEQSVWVKGTVSNHDDDNIEDDDEGPPNLHRIDCSYFDVQQDRQPSLENMDQTGMQPNSESEWETPSRTESDDDDEERPRRRRRVGRGIPIFKKTMQGGKQRFVCERCGKSYASKRGCLTHHETVHVNGGVSRYRCPVCFNSLSSVYTLNRHIRTAHPEFDLEAFKKFVKH